MIRHIAKGLTALGVFVLGAAMTYAIIVTTVSSQDKAVTTSIAVDKPQPGRGIEDMITDESGRLIVTYTDGVVKVVGIVKGNDGVGQYPTQAQLAIALADYCRDGRCDAKQPTQPQIVAALGVYCGGGICKGQDGKSPTPITAEQIATAVSNFCSTGVCKGTNGVNGAAGLNGVNGTNGAKGLDGSTTSLSCVTRPLNGTAARYIAWKYTTEPDEAFRNLYKLPTWAEADNCKIL